MRFLLVYAILAVAVCLGALGAGCSASPPPVYTQGTSPDGGASQPPPGDSSVPQLGNGDAGAIGITDATPGIPGILTAIVRDFRLYDASDPTTVPDFENPPNNIGNDGGPDPGYTGSWYDDQIVGNALGSDNTPVYLHPGQTTVTTHGADAFQKWYHDVPGTNINVSYPIQLHPADAGVYAYDSVVDGVPYNLPGIAGDGFFPIDDGSQYQTAFGDQGLPHNYSFTMEIHTVFTYQGGEFFQFRGDDDVFVFINKALVINLGGIHDPEPAQVAVDSLGLTKGQSYPLDFFSAERHVYGSNIEISTSLALQPVIPK